MSMRRSSGFSTPCCPLAITLELCHMGGLLILPTYIRVPGPGFRHLHQESHRESRFHEGARSPIPGRSLFHEIASGRAADDAIGRLLRHPQPERDHVQIGPGLSQLAGQKERALIIRQLRIHPNPRQASHPITSKKRQPASSGHAVADAWCPRGGPSNSSQGDAL
jgi:hypothetical protein